MVAPDMDPAPAIDIRPLAAGSRLGSYQIERRLAVGGMAELYLARPDAGDPVALKRVHPHLAQDPDFTAMFVQEAGIAARLEHPNIVRLLDVGDDPHEHFYAMEYLHGEDVRSVLREAVHRGGIPLDCALAIVVGAAQGLHYAHESAGIVHRDVAPSNVVVTFAGEVKVVDFGIAKTIAQTRQTRAGVLKGKIGYMSPEACRGESVDRRADVFGLGVLLYETTTGRRLFFADNQFAIMNNIVTGTFDPPSVVSPGYPKALEAIVLRSLAVAKEDRFATAREMCEALRRFATDADLRLSMAPLSGFMSDLFGPRDYPTLVELAGPVPPPATRRRISGFTIAAAAAIPLALGLGVALGGGLARDEPQTTVPPPPVSAPPEPNEPAPSQPQAQVAKVASVDNDAEDNVPDEPVTKPSADKPVSKPPRSKSQRKRKKRPAPRANPDKRDRLFPKTYYEDR